MFYVGIDISKYKHTLVIASHLGEIIQKPLDFDNSQLGFKTLLDILKPYDSKQLKIGFESTGHYSANLIQFLLDQGYSFYQLNAHLVKKFSLSLSTRKAKTDKIDSLAIAKFLMTIDSKSFTPLSYHMSHLKSLTRHYYRLNKYIGKTKVELVNYLDKAFPEFATYFTSIYGKTSLNILLTANSLLSIARLSESRFESLRKLSRGRFKYSKYLKLKQTAKQSVGLKDDYLWHLLHLVIRRIHSLQVEKDSIEDEIKHIMDDIQSPLPSIPGMGITSAAIILSEIEDIFRFPNTKSLIAFAGLDNSVYQSGTESHYGKISKRGSKYLRTTLYSVSLPVISNSKLFYEYYFDKKSKGKSHKLSLIWVSRKMLRVIYHLLKNNETFIDQKV
ncbi:MAG: IS110 family transposase [Tenericutes bacterium]|jgi:transposase|nr:IS110 family transposase [Mycoplasmatota bacterium]